MPGREPLSQDALLADAVRMGWLTPSLGPVSDSPPRRPVTTLANLLEELQADRAD